MPNLFSFQEKGKWGKEMNRTLFDYYFSCAGTVAPRKQIFASTRQPCRQPQLEQTELEPSLVPPLRHGQIRARLLMHIDVSGPHATTCHGDTAN
jgi:hypothetical protein